MTTQQLFVKANEELKKVIDQIRVDQWDLQMPEGLTSKLATLLESVNYHTYDDAWVGDVLSGKTKEEVGDVFEHLLTSKNTKEDYDRCNLLAIAAVESYEDLDKIVHLSYGDFTAREYLQHITIFRVLRVYDIAKLIGCDTTLAPDLLQGMWEQYATLVDGYRQYGILPAALKVDESADSQTKFLALVGRS